MAVISAMAFLTCACGFEDEPDEPDGPVVCPPDDGPTGRAVLVYMVANNSLGSAYLEEDVRGYDTADISEMLRAASEGALGGNRLILYHHAYRTDPVLTEVTPDGLVELKTYDTSDNSVTAKRMREVITDFKAIAPAERCGIVLWSHASGWEQNGIVEENASPVLKAYGLDGGKQMNVTTLADVLDGEGFDYVYFDCCHMAGVEVAYQLRNVTGKIVGSVTELPAAGMPYDITLPYLMADEADVEGAAASTFGYYDRQTSYRRTCTMSVIDTSKLGRVAETVGALYAMHPALPSSYRPQKFIYSNCVYYDLEHYLRALCDGHEEMDGILADAVAAIDDALTYRGSTPWLWQGLRNEVEIVSHCGLSTYILSSETDSQRYNYCDLQWYEDVASRLFE